MKSARLALAGIGVALLTYALAMLVNSGTFSEWTGGCGEFGVRCLGQGAIVLLVGCLAGAVLALVSLGRAATRTWLGWVALLMNGLPLAPFCVAALLIAMH